MELLIKGIIFAFLLIGVFLLLYGVTKEEHVKSKAEEIRNLFQKSYVERRYVSDYFQFEWARKIDECYKYSRIFTKSKRFQTSISYFLFSNFVGIFAGVILGVSFRSFNFVVVSYVGVMVICYGYLLFLRSKNKRNVNGDVIMFLNLLGNYSTGNTEATSVFMQIAPKMNEPLRSCLVECVAESQENSMKALKNLQNKVESRKFHEIIKSIMIAQRYSGSFSAVVVQNRSTIQSFIKSQKERKELAMQNSINMAVCFVALIGILMVLSQLVGQNILALLVTTTLGNVVLFIAIACVIYFIVKVIEVSV